MDGIMNIFYIFFFGLVIATKRGPHHPRSAVAHTHSKPSKKLTEDIEILHDKAHMQEDLKDLVHEEDLSQLSDEELEFYYFRVHDTDNNTKLDGLEILKAVYHTTHEEDNPEELDSFIELIDRVLEEDDLDRDGFLSYPEYVSGRKKAITNEQQPPKVQLI